MFKLNLKIALRNIWRHKLTTSIKLIGLVVGLSCVAVLVSYVLYELSYDKHNEQASRIYRLHQYNAEEQKERVPLPSGAGKMLVQEVPEVENSAELSVWDDKVKIKEEFYPARIAATANSFLHIFTIPLISGNIDNALQEPHTAIVSEQFAKTVFPNASAIGQQISMGRKKDYTIVGVMKDFPSASHFKADLLVSENRKAELNWQSYTSVPQYIMLKKGASVEHVTHKLAALYKKYQFPKGTTLKLMPLTSIHLYSHTDSEIEPNSDIKYIYIFSIVAGFILFIALINYINLTIAAALKRGKEIGVKKVLGASVNQLRLQFLSESYIYFIVAAFFVLVITSDVIPLLGSKLGIDLNISNLITPKTLMISLGIIVVSGFIAGFYPAIVLSRLMPVKTLKGNSGQVQGKFGFRKFLMVFQFAASALLIVCTMIIYSQLSYISNKKLGFDKENLLVSDFMIFGKDFQPFKDELLKQKGVKNLSVSSFNPGFYYGFSTSWTNDNDTTKYAIDGVSADIDFIRTLNIKLVKGRSFSKDFGSDMFDYEAAAEKLEGEASNKMLAQEPIILTESAVKMLNLKNPIDTILQYGGLRGKVIGVANDFNGKSLHNKVSPLLISLSLHRDAGYLYLKTDGADLNAINKTVARLWKKHFTTGVAEFQFLDTHLQKLYKAEMRLGKLFILFAGIAIFLCCIGLFGMVYFDLEHRTKEIAVRKILGASVKDLLALLNNGFVKIVLIANILIWPLAWYLINEWLNTFYYRIDLSFLPFAGSLLICLLLTVFTVSMQTMKTIRKSPVNALKYE